MDVRGVATVTDSLLRLPEFTSAVRGRVLMISVVRVVVRVPVDRKVDSFRNVGSVCERTADELRTPGVLEPFTTRTVRSADTTELRVTMRSFPVAPTRAVPPEMVCRVEPL